MGTITRLCVCAGSIGKLFLAFVISTQISFVGPFHFSHAVIVGSTAYIAGLIGNDPDTTEMVSEDTGEQADQVDFVFLLACITSE